MSSCYDACNAKAWKKALTGFVSKIAATLAPGRRAAFVVGDSVAANRAISLNEALTSDLVVEAWASQERPMMGVTERRASSRKSRHVGPRSSAAFVGDSVAAISLNEELTSDVVVEPCASQERPMMGVTERRASSRKSRHVGPRSSAAFVGDSVAAISLNEELTSDLVVE